tara:strand:+ start:233 stop:616 length:384 start_codon:yes stop_codon:yes gene_type:complete
MADYSKYNSVGDGYASCLCTGACEHLGYCPNNSKPIVQDWATTTIDILKPQQKIYVVTGGMEYDGQSLYGCYDSVESAEEFIRNYIETYKPYDDFFHIFEMVVGEDNLESRYEPMKTFSKKVSFVEE